MRLVRLAVPFVLCGLLIMLVAACGSRDDDSVGGAFDADVEVTEADNGKSYTVRTGDHIQITLNSNPTTGYEWAVQSLKGTVISYLGSNYQSSGGNMPGTGGTQTLTFRAELPGDSPIELKYWRSFEGDSSIGQTFSIQITVEP